MSVGQLVYSVDRHRAWQRSLALIATTPLMLGVIVCTGMMATGRPVGELVLAAASALVLGPGVFWRRPEVAFYVTLLCAILIEQFGIAGLDPITTQTHFFQSFSGFTPLPLPIMAADIVVAPALLALSLRALARSGPFYRGALFGPVMLLAGAVPVALAYGVFHQTGITQFNPNAAWAEGRSFVQLACVYLLAANVINSRRRVVQTVWIFIIAVTLKGVQGTQNFIIERQLQLSLEAITGHEDVVFFGTFFLLFAAMNAYGGDKRQNRLMLLALPVIGVTELATARRNAFIILAVGLILLGISLWRFKTSLFNKSLPAVLIVLSVYTIAFWDNTEGTLGQPIRAFKSQIGYASERDRLSDYWRILENQNIDLNIKANPILGIGLGRPYAFYIEEPSLDATGFVYWDYITHDAIMWVWMKMGLYGFITFWYLCGSAMVYGLVTFKRLSDGYLRAIALTIVALVAMQVVFSYTDLGLTYSRSMIFLGCMLGLLVRLQEFEAPASAVAASPVR
jgi:hypothetical protein